ECRVPWHRCPRWLPHSTKWRASLAICDYCGTKPLFAQRRHPSLTEMTAAASTGRPTTRATSIGARLIIPLHHPIILLPLLLIKILEDSIRSLARSLTAVARSRVSISVSLQAVKSILIIADAASAHRNSPHAGL